VPLLFTRLNSTTVSEPNTTVFVHVWGSKPRSSARMVYWPPGMSAESGVFRLELVVYINPCARRRRHHDQFSRKRGKRRLDGVLIAGLYAKFSAKRRISPVTRVHRVFSAGDGRQVLRRFAITAPSNVMTAPVGAVSTKTRAESDIRLIPIFCGTRSATVTVITRGSSREFWP